MPGIGFVKLWRKSLESGWLHNHTLWAFWSYCLMKASHKKHIMKVGYQQVELLPGQFVFGRRQAAIDLKTTERKVRTCLDALVKMKNLTTKTTNKFSIISIVNWQHYQGATDTSDQQVDQQPTNNRPTTDHKQECKEEIKTIVEHLNSKTDSNFSCKTKATQEHINARLSEGRTVDDFKAVIDIKASQWMNTEQQKYLRPQTLFIPANFEGYLNEKPKPSKYATR